MRGSSNFSSSLEVALRRVNRPIPFRLPGVLMLFDKHHHQALLPRPGKVSQTQNGVEEPGERCVGLHRQMSESPVR